ncbi:MAG: aminoacyl-tRNA hydrolase [Chloroflexota bacterium]
MRFWRHDDSELSGDAAYLVVGLGNPGRQYEKTRHNIGFMAVEALAQRHGLVFKGTKQAADLARGTICGVTVLLAEPLTFMNESGIAVSSLMKYYKIDKQRLLVVCDDIDLTFGTLRFRTAGSSGGQRGLQSIIQSVGGNDFARLKLGVGRPHREAVGHVLGRFPPEQEAVLPGLLDLACDAMEAFLTRDGREIMNDFNRDWLPQVTDGAAGRRES